MREVNKALLTQEQAALYEEWKRLFAGPGWGLFVERFGPLIPYTHAQFRSAKGAQELGYIQGWLTAANMLLNPELLVENDFLSMSGEEVEAPDPEARTGPMDWQE